MAAMVTRRSFFHAAAAVPVLTEAVLAQRALVGNNWPADTVWLNANENPDGPPPAAIAAMNHVAPEAWRYHYPEFRDFYAAVARSEQLDPGQVVIGAGSTEVLNVAVAALTAPGRPLITPDPTFEVPVEIARAMGRPCVRVPLTETYAADVKRMAAEADKAGGGLIYLCNPNNPTASLTPKEDIAWLVANLPRNAVLLLDEAYIHFVDNYESLSGLAYVRQAKDVIVARTFSKIYGMAGLRVGFGCGKPELIGRLQRFRNNVISIVSARAVLAALAGAGDLLPARRARLIKVRTDLCQWLRRQGLKYIEPYANFIMIDTGRDARELGMAMIGRSVAVGRPFPPYDKMLRVSIGSERDMTKFKEAFLQVYKG